MSPVLGQSPLTSPSSWDTNDPVLFQDQQIFQMCLGMRLGMWGRSAHVGPCLQRPGCQGRMETQSLPGSATSKGFSMVTAGWIAKRGYLLSMKVCV